MYTYLIAKEDMIRLYGFKKKEELEAFKLLITVSGIGAKGALAILSTLSISDLKFAVLSDDHKSISAAPGIGAKTAQKLIVELRDKIDKISGEEIGEMMEDSLTSLKQDVIDGMNSLGYSPASTLKVLSQMDISEDDSVEDVLSAVIKQMAFQ